ncbi:ferredoxin [Rhodococcus sp. NPDC003348]
MRIVLDRPRCEGHGLCEEAAPALMHLDDDGELVIDAGELTDGSPEAAAAGAAVRVCPVAALELVLTGRQ